MPGDKLLIISVIIDKGFDDDLVTRPSHDHDATIVYFK